MVRYLFYTIGDLTYQSPLVVIWNRVHENASVAMLYRNMWLPRLQEPAAVFLFWVS